MASDKSILESDLNFISCPRKRFGQLSHYVSNVAFRGSSRKIYLPQRLT